MKIILIALTLIISIDGFSYHVIVNKRNRLQAIKTQDLKSFFYGDKLRWDDNSSVHIVDYNANSPLRKLFTDEVIGVSISRVYKTWIRLSLSGGGAPPKILRSEEEVVDMVSDDSNAIGYIEKEELASQKNIKIIKVEK